MSIDAFDPSSCRIALLAGGSSGERDISLASGNGAAEALKEAGFPVTVLDPANRNDLVALIEGNFDVAFICLHGRLGEDGAIQGLLELLDMPYIGSGIWASATAMDKAKSKDVYLRAGLPTPRSVTVRANEGTVDYDAIVETVGEHCVVKAPSEGSSLGLYMVERAEDLPAALDQAFALSDHVVVETFIAGDEFTCVVVGNEDPHAFPVIQIVPANDFYDFDAKYAPGGSRHLCPAPLSDEVTQRLQQCAVNAHRALECAGVSRTDFIVDENDDCWLLETNTIPGMTTTSLLPDAARAAGMSFPEICTELVKLAIERHEADASRRAATA